MAYVLMTRMDYLELTNKTPSRRRGIEFGWEKEDRERFKCNHPMAYQRGLERAAVKSKLYDKYRFGLRPNTPLSGAELDEAIQICSENPNQCTNFYNALSEVGVYHASSAQKRVEALAQMAGVRGSLVLVKSGSSGGGAPASKDDEFISMAIDRMLKPVAAHNEMEREALPLTAALAENSIVETINTVPKVFAKGKARKDAILGWKTKEEYLKDKNERIEKSRPLESSDWSKNMLAGNEAIQRFGEDISEITESMYENIGDTLGETTEFLAREMVDDAGDALTLIPAGYGVGAGVKGVSKVAKNARINAKYSKLNADPNIANHLKNVDGYDPAKVGIQGGITEIALCKELQIIT